MKRIRLFFSATDESLCGMADKIGIERESPAEGMFFHLGSEVDLVFDVDPSTGIGTLVGAGGFFLGDEKITEGEIEG